MSTTTVHRDNGEPWFEIETVGTASTQPESPLRGARTDAAVTTLRDAGEVIAKVAEDIVGSVRDALDQARPDSMELTFGVSVGAEGAIPLVTKATGEATFEVHLSWSSTSSD